MWYEPEAYRSQADYIRIPRPNGQRIVSADLLCIGSVTRLVCFFCDELILRKFRLLNPCVGARPLLSDFGNDRCQVRVVELDD